MNKSVLLSLISLILLQHHCISQVEAPTYFYQVMNNTMDIEKPISYVGLYNSFHRLESNRSLTPEEGSEGYKVEFNSFLKFPVLQKHVRDLATDKFIIPFFAYSRIWIDYGFHTRVANGVESSPILPPTNRYGFKIDKLLFARIRQSDQRTDKINGLRFKLDGADTVARNAIIKMFFVSVNRHHYSNSQPDGVFKDNNPALGNDYIAGDFSTNYWRFSLSYHWYKTEKAFFSATAGYQFEFGKYDGTFKFIKEQEGRYGKKRFVSTVQYQKAFRPILFGAISQFRLRWDSEYILDAHKLSEYPYANKYPLSMHGFVEFPIYYIPALAILFHGFYGRDYLNNRYDDPIWSLQVGVSLEISRFTLPLKDEELAIYLKNRPTRMIARK